jgi:hypothetical protein
VSIAHKVVEQAFGLTSGALQAIAELERQVVEADGGRLKLEWDNLRGRSGDRRFRSGASERG